MNNLIRAINLLIAFFISVIILMPIFKELLYEDH